MDRHDQHGHDQYNPHDHRDVEHPTSNIETMIHLLKGNIGTGTFPRENDFFLDFESSVDYTDQNLLKLIAEPIRRYPRDASGVQRFWLVLGFTWNNANGVHLYAQHAYAARMYA